MAIKDKKHKFVPGDVVYYGNTPYSVGDRDSDEDSWNDAGMPLYIIEKRSPFEPGIPIIGRVPESHLGTKPLMERVYLLEQLLVENVTRDNTPKGTTFLTLEEMREMPVGTRVETADGFDLLRSVFGWVVLAVNGTSWSSNPADAEHLMWLRPTKVKK